MSQCASPKIVRADLIRFWYGMLTFGLGLTIPQSEVETCMHLARPAYEALSLVNDIYSWPKERADAAMSGQDHVFNAVWVVMRERHCDESTALGICRDTTLQVLKKFEHILDSLQDLSLSLESRQYLEALRQSYIGNLVWSIYCPRYSINSCSP